MGTMSQMPMGMSANRLSLEDEILPDLNLGGGRAPLSLDAPTAMPQGAPIPPQTQTPATPPIPWDVRLQPDGSSVNYIKGPDGAEIILNVNQPPKLPKAYQGAQTMPKPNGPQPSPSPMQ